MPTNEWFDTNETRSSNGVEKKPRHEKRKKTVCGGWCRRPSRIIAHRYYIYELELLSLGWGAAKAARKTKDGGKRQKRGTGTTIVKRDETDVLALFLGFLSLSRSVRSGAASKTRPHVPTGVCARLVTASLLLLRPKDGDPAG